ncbi:MAG: EamA family transporter [Rectinemataceae bacterium]|nr:EamA family transporter [Rectinemataceae bacterium]
MTQDEKNTVSGAISLCAAAAIWGGVFVVSKYVMDYIPPFAIIWIRYVIAFAMLWGMMRLRARRISRTGTGSVPKPAGRDWILVAAIGFVGYFVSIACQFTGTKLADAHTGALITSASPVFTVLFARLFLGEPVTPRKIASLIVSGAGVLVIIGISQGNGIDGYALGVIVLVLAAVTWALLSVFVRMASFRLDSMTITTWAILFAAAFTTPAMLVESRTSPIVSVNPAVIAGILYIGVVSTALAYYLWNKGLERIDAGRASLFIFVQPVVGSILGWMILGERLSTRFFAGGILVLAGVTLSILGPARKSAPEIVSAGRKGT